MIATAHRTTHFRPRIIRGHAELPPQGRQAYHGLGMATATRQMRDRVERIMKEGLACDCCSAEIKALFTEWIENRECTLKTKEIADKLIPLMEACQCEKLHS